MDNLKVGLTWLVVAHHAGQAYGPTGGVWLIKDSVNANWLGNFFFVNAAYMMGLYFFISGYFMVFSLQRKSTYQFVVDRLKRLGIPLLFFIGCIFTPLHFFLSETNQSWWTFAYDLYMHQAPLATGHLWFVASLLAYSFLYVFILHRWIGSHTKPIQQFPVVRFGWVLLGIIVASMIIRLYYPIDRWTTWIVPLEPAHLPQYFGLFLLGIYVNHTQGLALIRPTYAIYGALIAILGWIIKIDGLQVQLSSAISEPIGETLFCLGVCGCLLTLAKFGAAGTNRLMELQSQTSYGIYLFHLLIVIAIQQLLLEIPLGANAKFVLVTIFGFLSSMALTWLLQRMAWFRALI